MDLVKIGKAVDSVIENIHWEYRAGQKLIVLQYYDMLVGSPDVESIAALALNVRPEFAQLEAMELAVNALDPGFLSNRLRRQYVANHPKDPNLLQVKFVDPEVPVDSLAKAIYEMERRIETAWGVCLLAAREQTPDEEEHHIEMVVDFERLFERPSDLLRALNTKSRCAMDVLTKYTISEGKATPDVLMAALTKHAPHSTTELTEFVNYARTNDIRVTAPVAEALEKCYVRCMKTEGAEEVFERLLTVGLVPLSTRPFAMICNSKNLSKGKTILDYYELMLDYGIAPEPSILRILCKQCTGMEYASLHFTLKVKSQMAAAEEASQAPQGSPSHSGKTSASQSPPPQPDSRRKNERAYFEKRLEDLAELSREAAPLMEALKVVHRAEVEGTSLEGDTLLLSCILRLFCNGTTPVADLVVPFCDSKAYHPGSVKQGETGAVSLTQLERLPVLRESNAFNFGFDGTHDELLEEVGTGELTLEEEMHPNNDGSDASSEGDGELRGGRNDHGRGSGHTTEGSRSADIARPAQEAEYVLKVFAEYGSYPDANLHRGLADIYEVQRKWKHHWDIDIIQHVAQARFKAGHERRGAVEPVRSGNCHCLVHYYVRHRQRQRLVELVSSFIVQYYEYHTIFVDNWLNHPSRASHYRHDNLFTFFTAAMKAGPLDWALGLLALALTTSESSINTNTQARLYQVRDSEMYRSPHSEVVSIMRSCDWDRDNIFCCDALMLDAAEQQQMQSGNSEAASASGSIYTTSLQEPSSYTNPRAAEQHLTFINYMHIALREMKVDKEVMDYYKRKLREAIQKARADRAARARGPPAPSSSTKETPNGKGRRTL